MIENELNVQLDDANMFVEIINIIVLHLIETLLIYVSYGN
jgi:hypothetical protein